MRQVTFYHSDEVERQTGLPVADAFRASGRYEVHFTDNLFERSDIGIYCQHFCAPSNSRFSVVMLHDLGQGHNRWPNLWKLEPWDNFDIGILPGPGWTSRWQQSSDDPSAHPRLGVFELGWPKADKIFNAYDADNAAHSRFGKELGLKHPKTVLYAPSWENDGKQNDVVMALKDLPINVLLKQAPWSDHFPQVLKSIKEMNALHKDRFDNVTIIDRNTDIMDCIAASDLIVSDESSVMIEGLVLNVPSVAVMDWLIPDCVPSRKPDVPFEWVRKTTRAELRQTVEDLLLNNEEMSLRDQATGTFTMLGRSANSIFMLVDAAVNGKRLPFDSIAPTRAKRAFSLNEHLNRWVRETKNSIWRLRQSLS